MNPSNANSASASDATPSKPPVADSSSTAAAQLSEAEFLKQQAQAAGNAIKVAFEDLKADLSQGADPRAWVKSHPWITLGTIAVAGFAAASVTSRNKHRILKHVESALREGKNGDQPRPAGSASGGIGELVVKELIGIAKPILMAAIATKMNPSPDRDTGPGDKPVDEPTPTGT